jgi:hypothetical protein
MTQILGTLDNPTLSGSLVVELTTTMTSDVTDPDIIYTKVPRTFAIAGGVINITLPESETYQVPYKFTFTKTGDTEPLFSFYKIVPNVATVQFASFFPTGITARNLDTSALQVARLMATNPTLGQLIKQPAIFSASVSAITTAQTFFLPKPFEGAIMARTLTVLGLSGYANWSFQLGVLNSSGNEEVLTIESTSTNTQNGRRRIHQIYNISRAASVMGLFVRATPLAGSTSLSAILSASYTEV